MGVVQDGAGRSSIKNKYPVTLSHQLNASACICVNRTKTRNSGLNGFVQDGCGRFDDKIRLNDAFLQIERICMYCCKSQQNNKFRPERGLSRTDFVVLD